MKSCTYKLKALRRRLASFFWHCTLALHNTAPRTLEIDNNTS